MREPLSRWCDGINVTENPRYLFQFTPASPRFSSRCPAMPTLICPHCQAPQSISDEVYQKNAGKKCRCRQCQQPFTIEIAAPPPAAESEGMGAFDFLNDDSPPAAPAPAKAKPSATAKPAAPAPQAKAPAAPSPADDLDFSNLMGGSEPAPSVDFLDFGSVDASSPTVVAEAAEFPSFNEVAPAPSPAKASLPKAKAKPQLTELPQSVEDGEGVAPLADRPMLRFIAIAFHIIGYMHFGISIVGILIFVLLIVSPATGLSMTQMEFYMGRLLSMFLFLVSAVLWFAVSELIHMGLGMEARLYEISCRTQPRE